LSRNWLGALFFTRSSTGEPSFGRKFSHAAAGPAKIAGKTQEIRDLRDLQKGLSKSAIAKQLNIGRTSVRRLLAEA
jgi:DNA-binding NarL/FixJ family response regulator